MSLRETLKKAAGLLVEFPEETPDPASTAGDSDSVDRLFEDLERQAAKVAPRTVEELTRVVPGPALADVKAPAQPLEAAVTPDGLVDFAAIYGRAGLPACAFSAEQLLEMLASLPAELPLETRWQTVRVSLNALGKTIGATPEALVADASRKLAALTSYVEGLEFETAREIAEAEQAIAALEARIAESRQKVEASRQLLSQASRICTQEADRLDDVLEFFSLDVPPSKLAPAG